MDEIGTVMAKLAGIRKAIAALLDETARDSRPRSSYPPELVGHDFNKLRVWWIDYGCYCQLSTTTSSRYRVTQAF
jgi:hypothetical protein